MQVQRRGSQWRLVGWWWFCCQKPLSCEFEHSRFYWNRCLVLLFTFFFLLQIFGIGGSWIFCCNSWRYCWGSYRYKSRVVRVQWISRIRTFVIPALSEAWVLFSNGRCSLWAACRQHAVSRWFLLRNCLGKSFWFVAVKVSVNLFYNRLKPRTLNNCDRLQKALRISLCFVFCISFFQLCLRGHLQCSVLSGCLNTLTVNGQGSYTLWLGNFVNSFMEFWILFVSTIIISEWRVAELELCISSDTDVIVLVPKFKRCFCCFSFRWIRFCALFGPLATWN